MRDFSGNDPRFFKALNDLKQAMTLQQQGLFDDAEKLFARVVKKNPEYFDALHFYGLFKYQQGQFNEALKLITKAAKINPRSVNALSSLGVVLGNLGRATEALTSFDAALKLAPDHLPALVNRCNILNELGRYDETLAITDRTLKIDPKFHEIYIIRGAAFFQLHRNLEALESYDRALELRANSEMALVGRGNVFSRLRRHEDALAAYEKALALKPDLADAWLARADIFLDRHQFNEAVAAYEKALALKPKLAGAEGLHLHAKMHLCDWRNFDADRGRLLSGVKNGTVTLPLVLLAVSSAPDLQVRCATTYSNKRYLPFQKPNTGRRHSHERLRIAYLSADFGDHPTSYLTAGMYEKHDHVRFETFAISFRRRHESEILVRLKGSFDQFIDVTERSDADVAKLLHTLEIDIAVDLMGYTTDCRPAILAQRASPIQVNYLGYPGTMGAGFIDYIVADNFVIPDTQRDFYTEKVIYLPDVFQANDSKRMIDNSPVSRADVDLPEKAFVFCCFNNSYKITPDCFDVWMRLLGQVDGSVLWLLGRDSSVEKNLGREAENRGISAGRLIFTNRKPYPNYLAQYRLADLFLDTFAFNAGATASDALWAGLPIITFPGKSFASRMAGSLLNAVGLPEMVTESAQDYAALASSLARNPDRMTAIRKKLADNIPNCSLFNTELFTRRMEAAYMAIYQRYQEKLPADHIYIPKQVSDSQSAD